MKVLIACESSGRVRDAFRNVGHDAISCDLLRSEVPGPHIQRDVRELLTPNRWDMMIAFPPCTHLCSSGARWFKDKAKEQEEALEFFRILLDAPIDKIALENPVGIISTHIRKPDQIINPWQFGHGETKKTCLWLKNLPLLKPTHIVDGRATKCHDLGPYRLRSKMRSLTYKGIAKAMAEQWGKGPYANDEPTILKEMA